MYKNWYIIYTVNLNIMIETVPVLYLGVLQRTMVPSFKESMHTFLQIKSIIGAKSINQVP